MSRGDRQKSIYLDDVDRQDFLKTLAETCPKTGFQVHAYWSIPGAAWGGIWRRRNIGPNGFGWTDCWSNMGSWKSLNNMLYLASKSDAKQPQLKRANK